MFKGALKKTLTFDLMEAVSRLYGIFKPAGVDSRDLLG